MPRIDRYFQAVEASIKSLGKCRATLPNSLTKRGMSDAIVVSEHIGLIWLAKGWSTAIGPDLKNKLCSCGRAEVAHADCIDISKLRLRSRVLSEKASRTPPDDVFAAVFRGNNLAVTRYMYRASRVKEEAGILVESSAHHRDVAQ